MWVCMLKIPHLEEIILSFFKNPTGFYNSWFLSYNRRGHSKLLSFIFFSSIKTSLKSLKREDIYVLFNKEKISFIHHNLVVQYGA